MCRVVVFTNCKRHELRTSGRLDNLTLIEEEALRAFAVELHANGRELIAYTNLGLFLSNCTSHMHIDAVVFEL